MPKTNIDTEFEKLLQEIKVDYRALAKEHKAFERARNIKSVDDLMRVVYLYCGVDQSLREVGANMTLLGTRLTDQSVLERLEKSLPWLKAVVSKTLALPTKVMKAIATSKCKILIADMTDVVGPGADGSQWRVHMVIDACSLEVVDINISDYHTVESLRLIKGQAGDLTLTDRAYCRRDAIFETVNGGVDVVTRYNHKSLPVYDLFGYKIDLMKHFRKQKRESVATTEVLIDSNKGEERKVWLHSYRLSKKDAAIARQKCRRKNRKVKSGVSELTLFMAEMVVVVSTIAPTQLPAQAILELYRCRWQVELVIKRFKSLLKLDKLRTKLESALAPVWLYGKMLYVLMVESAARRVAASAYQFASQRKQTPWRLLKLFYHFFNNIIIASAHWQQANWQAAINMLAERKRKRVLQSLPLRVKRFLSNLTPLAIAA